MKGTLHVVGAGLAGLACAVAAARVGVRVVVHEAAGHAGGRCRSYRDRHFDRILDNGTHLLVGANRQALAFAEAIGGTEALEPLAPCFPFLDLETGEGWGLSTSRLTVSLPETAKALGLPWIGTGQTVAERLGRAPSFRRLWQPLCEAILNTSADEASARLFARVLRGVLLRGSGGLRPYLFPLGLSAAFAAPAEATLALHGAELRFRHSLRAVSADRLEFDTGTVPLGPNDRAVLALPPWALAPLLPVPDLAMRTIVNAHFLLERPVALPGGAPFLGLVGGLAQWLFTRHDLLSVTVSAADNLAALPGERVAALLWSDCARVLGLPADQVPPAQVLKERRATLAHTPEGISRRPPPTTAFPRLFLAGDWIRSPWPCTIEAAVSSGLAAARLAVGRADLSFASG